MSLLPTRDRISEEAFLRSLQPDPQEDTITELVEQAMQEKRIQLAAQLVQLLPTRDNESSTLVHARKAAQFLLVHGEDYSEENLFDLLDSENLGVNGISEYLLTPVPALIPVPAPVK